MQPFQEPSVTVHQNEALLQAQVLQRPSLLPTQPNLAMVAEVTLHSGARVDLIGVSAEGRVWIVECKLAANPQIKREIVGQVLAYAGELWKLSVAEFERRFESRNDGESLHAGVESAVGHDVDADELRQGLSDSLANGEFTLVLAVDKITDELKTIVEFLDQQTVPAVRVMALELAYYKEGNVEILSPVTYGDQLSKPVSPGTSQHWNRDGFVDALNAVPNIGARNALEGLLAHGDDKGRRPFWGSGGVPGMSYYYSVGAQEAPVWAMYLKPNGAVVAVSFGSIAHVWTDAALKVLAALKSNPGFAPYVAAVDTDKLNKYPNIPAHELAKPGQLQAFLDALTLAIA